MTVKDSTSVKGRKASAKRFDLPVPGLSLVLPGDLDLGRGDGSGLDLPDIQRSGDGGVAAPLASDGTLADVGSATGADLGLARMGTLLAEAGSLACIEEGDADAACSSVAAVRWIGEAPLTGDPGAFYSGTARLTVDMACLLGAVEWRDRDASFGVASLFVSFPDGATGSVSAAGGDGAGALKRATAIARAMGSVIREPGMEEGEWVWDCLSAGMRAASQAGGGGDHAVLTCKGRGRVAGPIGRRLPVDLLFRFGVSEWR